MRINRDFIEKVIKTRTEKKDPPTHYATRNKASPIDKWERLETFDKTSRLFIYQANVDGVTLKFRNTTLIINGRHRAK